MKKRVVQALIVLATMACVVALFVRPGGSIDFDSFQKLKVGMNRQQVEDILGGPARVDGKPNLSLKVWSGEMPKGVAIETWGDRQCVIRIHFVEQDTVAHKQYEPSMPEFDEPFWSRVRSWLPW
jgi:hypothetical protein